jgi:HisJ family histidinol phosphate phosphatase
LNQTRPLVVGHFDLIRLFSDEPDRDLMGIEGVRELMVRNLKAVVEIGGLLEVNTSALRKGMREPYPGRSIIEVCAASPPLAGWEELRLTCCLLAVGILEDGRKAYTVGR